MNFLQSCDIHIDTLTQSLRYLWEFQRTNTIHKSWNKINYKQSKTTSYFLLHYLLLNTVDFIP